VCVVTVIYFVGLFTRFLADVDVIWGLG